MDKYKIIFDTSHLRSDMNGRSVRSGAVTLVSQGLMFFLQIGSTMVLARILSPEDYGIIAMAVAITGFANIFSYLGLSTATIQREDINHNQISTLFWINVAIGVFLSIIVIATSPIVAWFYNVPEMMKVMFALSFVFIITGFSVQHSALLTRQMRFYVIAKIRVLSMLIGILAAIYSAYLGAGYWALVVNTLVNILCSTIGFWIACRWIPGLPSKEAGVGSMIKFGMDLVIYNIISYFSRNLDNILIGRVHGSLALGFYSKAYQLLMMPISNLRDPITSVAMPALSRLQDDHENFKNYYLKCVSFLAFISMPIVVFMFSCSDQLINLFLGSQWMGASEIFKILALAAFIEPIVSTTGMVLISRGRSRNNLKLGVLKAFVICLFFVLGLPWGAKGVAYSYVISNYLLFFPVLYLSFKGSPIAVIEFLKFIFKPFSCSILMGIVCHFILSYFYNLNYFLLILISFLISFSFYFLSLFFIKCGEGDLKEYLSYLNSVLIKKKTST